MSRFHAIVLAGGRSSRLGGIDKVLVPVDGTPLLGRAIDAQFAVWQLTPAEREVALLVLKGHGHKQIAGLTSRSERTVRQHAGVIYDKSGLRGRAELSAYFLQDLMLPEVDRR